MAKSINKFIVKLPDQTSFKPQLTVSVAPNKEEKNTFFVKLIHPNTKEVVYTELYKTTNKDEMKSVVEALNYGKTLLDKDEIKNLQSSIEYKEQIFIRQGKRGKMKLKTKESIASEMEDKEKTAMLINEGSDIEESLIEDDEIIEEIASVEDVEEETEDQSDIDEDESYLKEKKEKRKASVVKNKKMKPKKEKEVKNKKKTKTKKVEVKKKKKNKK